MIYEPTGKTYSTFVKCLICEARGKSFEWGSPPAEEQLNPAEEMAISAWNMRSSQNNRRRARAVHFTNESRIGSIYNCLVQMQDNFIVVWENEQDTTPSYYTFAVVEQISHVEETAPEP